MNSSLHLHTDELKDAAKTLTAGQSVLLSGTVYTARDAAHKRIIALLDQGKEPPFAISGAVIYYAGPTPAKPGMAVGSCGPTTAGRMDLFTPRLLALGLTAMIGKGQRSPQVVQAMRKYGAVYFNAVGGTGALIAQCIISAEEIAFPELGCESVKRMQVEKFPVVCAIDALGGNLFDSGPAQWRTTA